MPLCCRGIFAFCTHSGYVLPFPLHGVKARRHDFHHTNNNGNFGFMQVTTSARARCGCLSPAFFCAVLCLFKTAASSLDCRCDASPVPTVLGPADVHRLAVQVLRRQVPHRCGPAGCVQEERPKREQLEPFSCRDLLHIWVLIHLFKRNPFDRKRCRKNRTSWGYRIS